MDIVLLIMVMAGVAVGFETIFTAIGDALKPKSRDRIHLFGHSSLWYVPLYGIGMPLMFYLYETPLEEANAVLRGAIYTGTILAGEYFSMGLLRLINGESPSEHSYNKVKWSINGLTRLDFAPAFFVLSLVLENIYTKLT